MPLMRKGRCKAQKTGKMKGPTNIEMTVYMAVYYKLNSFYSFFLFLAISRERPRLS